MGRLAEIYNVASSPRYIGNYLNMQSSRVRMYIMNAGSVFTGCIGFSQWIKREFGAYPKREMLIELGKMDKQGREEHTLFGLFLWEKRKQKVW